MKITEKCGIILPKNPTPREIFAKDELISYIKKISGIALEVTEKYENHRKNCAEKQKDACNNLLNAYSRYKQKHDNYAKSNDKLHTFPPPTA